MSAGIVRHASLLESERVAPGVKLFPIVPAGPYAEAMFAYQYEVDPGHSINFEDSEHDLYFYILSGIGGASFGGLHWGKVGALEQDGNDKLAEGSSLYLLAGESVSISALDGSSSPLSVVVFSLPAPSTPWSQTLERTVDQGRRVASTRLGAASHQAATGDRQFEVLFDASNGSRGATLFVGFIPSSGAPQHYHLYDEICVIVRGEGALVSPDGAMQSLKKGSAFHVAPRLLHAIHNPNPEDLWILGLFRPEGSASAAFYPDGRPAPVDPVK